MSAESTFKFCLMHYQEVVEAIEEKRLDPHTPKQGGGGHCHISDPTAIKAIKNLAEVDFVVVYYGTATNGCRDSYTIRRPESWLKVVGYTKATFDGQIQWDLVYQRYCLQKDIADIVGNLHISPSLYHTMLNNVLCFAKGVATGLLLVHPK